MEDFFAGIAGRWPAGEEHLHWHVLPDPAVAAERLAVPCRELTHRPGLSPVLPRWSHITVGHLVGPVTEVTGAQVTQMTGQVRERCEGVAPFAVLVGRPAPWGGGIVCPVRPGHRLRDLWRVTAAAARDVAGGRFPYLPEIYDPHMSLAYSTAGAPDGPARAWLSDHDIGEVPFPVTHLSLVVQRHDGSRITWRVIEQVPLTGGPLAAGNSPRETASPEET
jgi:2'-5' RNA ligase